MLGYMIVRLTAEQLEHEAASHRAKFWRECCRPSRLRHVQVSAHLDRDGASMFRAEDGGLVVTGNTPEAACKAFDALWARGDDA